MICIGSVVEQLVTYYAVLYEQPRLRSGQHFNVHGFDSKARQAEKFVRGEQSAVTARSEAAV